MTLDYKIVVPSRKRPHNMPIITGLLPTSIICVDEREAADYEAFIPKERLLLHPPMEGCPNVRNFMANAVDAPILVQIDDDFRGVRTMVGSRRFITSPDDILAIIENAAVACRDLELTTFCWSRNPYTNMNKADIMPIVPTGPVCNAFGMMGRARYRKFDMSLHGRADTDWTLKTLLEDRCLYIDARFWFDFGAIYSGRGGSVDLVTTDQFERASRLLKDRWGCHVQFKSNSFSNTLGRKSRSVSGMSIKVPRKSPMAHK